MLLLRQTPKHREDIEGTAFYHGKIVDYHKDGLMDKTTKCRVKSQNVYVTFDDVENFYGSLTQKGALVDLTKNFNSTKML